MLRVPRGRRSRLPPPLHGREERGELEGERGRRKRGHRINSAEKYTDECQCHCLMFTCWISQ